DAAVIEVGGVGYLIHTPNGVLTSLKAGAEVKLVTHMVVREDAITLYGFETSEQRAVFGILVGVNGVGPKLALAVLSAFDPDALRKVVASGDVETLTAVPGVGKKGAQRMVLELTERLGAGLEAMPSASSEVRKALIGLGYTPAELRGVLDSVTSDAPVEEQIKAALKELARA
ncbi:MAG: Holliday junction branch migration protein RuvA, partial [Actinomycetota bacterium]